MGKGTPCKAPDFLIGNKTRLGVIFIMATKKTKKGSNFSLRLRPFFICKKVLKAKIFFPLKSKEPKKT